MKKSLHGWLTLVGLFFTLISAKGQGTAITYQGSFTQNGAPHSGTVEMRFTLWDAVTGGTQVAAMSPATMLVGVSNGFFNATLDFGPAVFTGGGRWLQLEARTTLGPFTTLTPRQMLAPTPYAVFAANAASATVAASANSVAAGNITGTLSLAQLPPSMITNTQNGVSLSGAFRGNGLGLTNLLPSALVLVSSNLSLTSWGRSDFGQRSVPSGLNDVVAASSGVGHGLALRANGTVVAWGAGLTNDPASNIHYGQSAVPPDLASVAAISAGVYHSMALKSNGTVVAWGWVGSMVTNFPSALSNVSAISAGLYHSMALRTNGTVAVWGTNESGQLNVPAGLNNVKAISAGLLHSLALRSNGTVVAWGTDLFGVINVPAGLEGVAAVSAGGTLSLALKSNGTVVVWGTNELGELDVPAGLDNVVGIATGVRHGTALKADGTVVVWGSNQFGERNPPVGLNNVAALVPTLGYHQFALRKRSQAPVAWLDSDNTFNGSLEVNGDIRASGEVTAAGGLALLDGPLWLRRSGDTRNALAWYGGEKLFGPLAPNGPVLSGEGGGALGTVGAGGQRVALSWNNQEQVTIGGRPAATLLRLGESGYGIGSSNSQFRLHLNGSGRFSFLDNPTGNELMTISTFNNSVGIGNPVPLAKLDVKGNIRLGFNGEYMAPAGVENLRILRGIVSSAGAVLNGTGFSVVKTGVGAYTINFTSGFSDLPAITANVQAGLSRTITTTSVTPSSAGFRIFASGAESAQDQQFHFIAIGQR